MLIAACTPIARAQSAGSAATPASGPPPIVATAFSYTGEVVADAAGGARRGATYTGTAAAQITVALRRIVGWSGLRLFVFVLDTHGGAPSDRVGDVQGVSNLQAPERLRLEELWLQQNVFANRLSVLAGRYDLNSEFYRLQSAGLFVNSSFGIGPELAQSGAAGPSIFPNTSVGARLALKPSPNAVLRVAVLDGVPVDRAHGTARLFAPGDGALLVGEAAILERPDSGDASHNPRFRVGRGLARSYTEKIAIDAWYYTARFPDLVDTLSTGEAVQHRGSRGAYVIAQSHLLVGEARRPGFAERIRAARPRRFASRSVRRLRWRRIHIHRTDSESAARRARLGDCVGAHGIAVRETSDRIGRTRELGDDSGGHVSRSVRVVARGAAGSAVCQASWERTGGAVRVGAGTSRGALTLSDPDAQALLPEHSEVPEQPPQQDEYENGAEASAAEFLRAVSGGETA